MFGYNKYAVEPTDPFGPEINITGFGNFGREIFLPSISFERHYQFQQSFDVQSGRHTVKFGVDVKIGWNPDSFGYSWQLPQPTRYSPISVRRPGSPA